jgi:hypothetical protein
MDLPLVGVSVATLSCLTSKALGCPPLMRDEGLKSPDSHNGAARWSFPIELRTTSERCHALACPQRVPPASRSVRAGGLAAPRFSKAFSATLHRFGIKVGACSRPVSPPSSSQMEHAGAAWLRCALAHGRRHFSGIASGGLHGLSWRRSQNPVSWVRGDVPIGFWTAGVR